MALAYPKLENSSRETIACDHFIDALDDPDFALKVQERMPVTLDDALQYAFQLEARMKNADRIRSQNRSVNQEKPALHKLKCRGVTASVNKQWVDVGRVMEMIESAVERAINKQTSGSTEVDGRRTIAKRKGAEGRSCNINPAARFGHSCSQGGWMYCHSAVEIARAAFVAGDRCWRDGRRSDRQTKDRSRDRCSNSTPTTAKRATADDRTNDRIGSSKNTMESVGVVRSTEPVSYTHLTLPTKRIV